MNLYVFCRSENKQRLFPCTALSGWLYIWQGMGLLCGTNWILKKNSSGYFFLSGRTMALAVIRRALTEESRVRSQICPCSNCGEQSGIDTCLYPSTSPFPVNITPQMVQTHPHTHITFTRRTNERSLGTSSSAVPEIGGEQWIENYFPFFFSYSISASPLSIYHSTNAPCSSSCFSYQKGKRRSLWSF